ncbi:MAG: nitrogen fixation protein [Acidobacteria bacterium]|nr:MAG: nitrogen fixation protein [Acidobacteriota bacterium]
MSETVSPCADQKRLMCPSAQPEMDDSVVLGVLQDTPEGRRLAWIEQPQPVTPQLLSLTRDVDARTVFRFAARCEEKKCVHFDGKDCQLATRIVQILPRAVEVLPPCSIRPECRWYQQEGKAACYRCPEVITHLENPSAQMLEAATPA